MTDYRTVKAWFQQCRDLTNQIHAQEQKIQRVRDAAEKCTQSLSGLPSGGSANDRVGSAVARLDAEERTLQQLKKQLASLKMEATCRAYADAKDKDSIRQGDCIRMFYIENKRQPEIVETFNLCENSEVSKLIRRGCERLALIWDRFA